MTKPQWLIFKENEEKKKMESLQRNKPSGKAFQLKNQHRQTENLMDVIRSSGQVSTQFKKISQELGFGELKTLKFLMDFYEQKKGML